MESFCCTLWKSVAEQIKKSFLVQLDDAEEKGVPAFTLLPQRSAIEEWGQHCPRCGTNIITGSKPVVQKAPEIPAKKLIVSRICPVCRGKKIVAGQGTQDPIKCIRCWGEGVVDERHQLDDSGGGLSQIDVPKGLEKND